MATLFSQEFIALLTPIFVFLFVFVVLYALLMKAKFFGDKAGFNLVIAFAVAMLVFLVPEAQIVVTSFTPWMLLLTILIIFIFMFFMFLGVKEKTLVEEVVQGGAFGFWIVLIIIILFLVALTKGFGPFLMANQQPGFWNSVKRVVFHPKTLGVLFVLAIAAYTARYIGSHEP